MPGSRAAPARHRPAHAHQPGPRPAGYCGQDPLVPCCESHPAPGDRGPELALIDLDLDVLPGCLLPSFGRRAKVGLGTLALGIHGCGPALQVGGGEGRRACGALLGRAPSAFALRAYVRSTTRPVAATRTGLVSTLVRRAGKGMWCPGLYRLCRCCHYSCSSACWSL